MTMLKRPSKLFLDSTGEYLSLIFCIPFLSGVLTFMIYISRWGVNKLEGFLRPLVAKGLRSVLIFGVIGDDHKQVCEHAYILTQPWFTLTWFSFLLS